MTLARWPALMMKETAAAYLDMTPQQFDRQCPVPAVDQGWRGYRWKKTMLDQWVETLPIRPRADWNAEVPAPTNEAEARAARIAESIRRAGEGGETSRKKKPS